MAKGVHYDLVGALFLPAYDALLSAMCDAFEADSGVAVRVSTVSVDNDGRLRAVLRYPRIPGAPASMHTLASFDGGHMTVAFYTPHRDYKGAMTFRLDAPLDSAAEHLATRLRKSLEA